ncbi:chemotaxis regulatory protein CheY [Pseudobythopirellula maris]|uniref:Chemotaxis regulatory protein CheY n=1 Tax=Pseudobythopirellula maris TaxID=2527991 RepID=A0A5C5ZMH6_9BACT|nr:response regulator [Pseudobythopirellula maris]TWT88296.1 chemotaxis regulatory protein CheY [Pseudobythopirellula maris]
MKRVLDVGNCDPDHRAITSFLTSNFDVTVDRARLPADTFEKLAAGDYHLVVINRKLDEDYSDGLEIIRQMKADERMSDVPVMLVTNLAEHQDAAEAAGALRGFGKLEYNDPSAVERVAAVLG